MSTGLSAVQEEYKKLATRYDRRYAAYVKASVAATFSRLAVGAHERVLDVGCGTGVLLRRLLREQPDAVLTGVDPSLEMLEVARHRLGSDVPLYESHSEQLPFEQAMFDVVVSTSAFHYFMDPPRALSEMQRVLVPGGRLVLTDWCANFFSSRLREHLLRLCGFGHFRTYSSEEWSALLTESGFLDIEIECYRIHWHWGLMTARSRARGV